MIKKTIALFAFLLLVGGASLTLVAPATVYAETPTTPPASTTPPAATLTPDDCAKPFLTFPAWFRGIVTVVDGECLVMSPKDSLPGETEPIGISNYVWRIVLNIIEIALHLIGYLAAFFIIYGGFRFMTKGDNPSEVEAARKTIMNAVIGLAISIGSIALVNFIFRIFL